MSEQMNESAPERSFFPVHRGKQEKNVPWMLGGGFAGSWGGGASGTSQAHTYTQNLTPVPTGPSGSLPATPHPAGATPAVQVTPQLETKSIGASVEFHCIVPSDQGTQLRWVKEGGQLPPGHSVHDGVLR